MQKQTSLYIPKPCHEDWNKMSPTQQGKFCGSCSKQVVDFSLMNDNQILHFLSNQSGKLCGRFDQEQLQRPLTETKIKKKKSWWMALTMPLLFLFEKSEAQANTYIKIDTSIQTDIPTHITLGKIVVEHTKQMIIKGKVVDENNDPVSFATISEKGRKNAVAADADGYYSIALNINNSEFALTASAVGFESTDKLIYSERDSDIIVMKKTSGDLGGVIVTVAGSINYCKRIQTIDTLHSTAKKLFGAAMFKMYPNPVVNNGIVNLQIKNTGFYQMQLFNNQSRLITAEEINVVAEKSTSSITIPSNIASGVYYVRLINEQTKKAYTEKLIIQ